jgi:hypothetical protein
LPRPILVAEPAARVKVWGLTAGPS